jgi:hypothetical protein
MPSLNNIITPNFKGRGEPERELQAAAAAFLDAFLRQYPGAGPHMRSGFSLKITIPEQTIFQLDGALNAPGSIIRGI